MSAEARAGRPGLSTLLRPAASTATGRDIVVCRATVVLRDTSMRYVICPPDPGNDTDYPSRDYAPQGLTRIVRLEPLL